jgi:hypothetical protein
MRKRSIFNLTPEEIRISNLLDAGIVGSDRIAEILGKSRTSVMALMDTTIHKRSIAKSMLYDHKGRSFSSIGRARGKIRMDGTL